MSYRIPQVLDPTPHFDRDSHHTFLQISTMIYTLILDYIHFWASEDSHLNISAASQLQWIFTGRTDDEAETPILWPPDAKSWLIGKGPDAGKDWRQEEKGMTEDEMVRWHHWLNGHGFGWTLGVGDGQGGLACCSSWGCKESDTTERLNWTELSSKGIYLERPSQTNQFKLAPPPICLLPSYPNVYFFSTDELFTIHILQLEGRRVGPFSLQYPRTWNL